MKAVRIHEFGDESVLKYEDAPDPVAGPDQVVIAVKAAALNRGDLGRRSGSYGSGSLELPFVIGWDVAGDVLSVGAGVNHLTPGQRVVSLLPHGGYAEQAAAPAQLTVPLPDGVSYDDAAALPVAYLTAWVALIDTCKLQPGESCLVQAVSSGVGMAAVQIARHVCRAGLVITTAGSDARAGRGKELGAHESINYTSTDFLAEVMRLTDGRGVDVVLELVGGETFSRSQQALAKGGRMVAGGRSSGQPSVVGEELAKERQQQIWASWGAMGGVSDQVRAEALADILELVRDRKLKVVIDRVFPLSEAAAAHSYLAGRNQFGKVLLRP